MIVYVGAGSGPLRDIIIDAGHGQMVSRRDYRVPKRGRWAFDNGAWGDFLHGEHFDDDQFLHVLNRISKLPDARIPDWCVVPDQIMSRRSLDYSLTWKAWLKGVDRRLKWYLALQDDMASADVNHALCLEEFDGLFIGGSTPWKLETSAAWVQFGHDRGMPVHIARINGPRRLQWAIDIDADSVDGTGWVHAGAKWLPWLVETPSPQPRIFSKKFQEEKLEAFLKNIWSDPAAWRRRFPDDPAEGWEGYDKIAEMTPREFAIWYRAAYPEGYDLTPEEAESVPEEEFQEWKWGIYDEAERYIGFRPVYPEAPNPLFVILVGGQSAIPLSAALRRGGTLTKCAVTKRPMVLLHGCTLPVVSAWTEESAVEMAKFIEGRMGPPEGYCSS